MKKDIRIDLFALCKWFIKKWHWILLGTIISCIAFLGIQYGRNMKSYQDTLNSYYSIEECEEVLTAFEKAQVRNLILLDQMIEKEYKNYYDLEMMESELTEEQMLELSDALDRLTTLQQLRSKKEGQLNPYMYRYFCLLGGDTDPALNLVKPTISKYLIFSSGLLGIMFAFAASIVVYLAQGYVHSEEEIRYNYKYPVWKIGNNAEECNNRIDYFMEKIGYDVNAPVAIVGNLKWDKAENSMIVEAIIEKTGGTVCFDLLEKIGDYKKAKKLGNILIVEKVNESKLNDLARTVEACELIESQVLGILLILE